MDSLSGTDLAIGGLFFHQRRFGLAPMASTTITHPCACRMSFFSRTLRDFGEE
jgi:hypothetical protein